MSPAPGSIPPHAASPQSDFDPAVRQLPDGELLLLARDGRRSAAVELWRRHTAYTMAVAHGSAPDDDWDSINTRAWTLVLDPAADDKAAGGFRPYVYFMIRALSSVEESPARHEDFLTAAYHDLPPRWHETLWYAHIESMRPARIARFMGLDPDSMPQLLHRARQGLRQEWVRHHMGAIKDDSDCRLVWEYSGAYLRGVLTTHERSWVETHLASCPVCRHAASDAVTVASHLPAIVLPTIAGSTGAANLLDYLRTNGPAVRSSLDLPAGVERLFGGRRRVSHLIASETGETDLEGSAHPSASLARPDPTPSDERTGATLDKTHEVGSVGRSSATDTAIPKPTPLVRSVHRPARLERLVREATRLGQEDPSASLVATTAIDTHVASPTEATETGRVRATTNYSSSFVRDGDQRPSRLSSDDSPNSDATRSQTAVASLPNASAAVISAPVVRRRSESVDPDALTTRSVGADERASRVDKDDWDVGDDDAFLAEVGPLDQAPIHEAHSVNRLTGKETDLALSPPSRRHPRHRGKGSDDWLAETRRSARTDPPAGPGLGRVSWTVLIAVFLIVAAAIILSVTRPWESREPVNPVTPDVTSSSSAPSPLRITAVDTGADNTLLPQVTGAAPAGTDVSVQIGDATVTVITDDTGQWTTASQAISTGLTRGQITVSGPDLPGPATAVYQIAEPPVLVSNPTNPAVVTLTGLANATVEVLIDGNPATVMTLDPTGTAATTLAPQPGNRFLQARYVADDRFGVSSEAVTVVIA